MVALFVILLFAGLILADFIVLKMQNKTHPALQKDSSVPVFGKNTILHPEGVFISKGHTWAKPVEDGIIRIGIDDFVLKALNYLKLISMPEPQSFVKKGDVIFQAISNGNTLNFRSPISGKVTLVNRNLSDKFITDPFENDWALEIIPSDFSNESHDLKYGKELTKWIKEEVAKLKEFLGHATLKPELVGATMYDGGNIVEGAVNFSNSESIQKFEEEFLKF